MDFNKGAMLNYANSMRIYIGCLCKPAISLYHWLRAFDWRQLALIQAPQLLAECKYILILEPFVG